MILITGGLGFLGSNLAATLIERDKVTLVSKGVSKMSNISDIAGKVNIDILDITRSDLLRDLVLTYKPDVIFHLAGQLTSYESFENPLYDVDVNSKTTLVILEAIRELKNTCRLILGSTFWVVGKPDKLPVNEETPCKPQNIYAANRLASENYCSIYHSVYDLDTVVMRLTNTFGIKEQYANKKKAALNNLLYMAMKGENIPIYNKGNFFRDYIYVSDVVSAAEAIMDKGRSGECYFVGTGIKTWFYDIGKWLNELTGCTTVNVNPPEYHKRIDVGNIVVDNNKLKGLGWDYKVSVKEGLIKTLDYYKECNL